MTRERISQVCECYGAARYGADMLTRTCNVYSCDQRAVAEIAVGGGYGKISTTTTICLCSKHLAELGRSIDQWRAVS